MILAELLSQARATVAEYDALVDRAVSIAQDMEFTNVTDFNVYDLNIAEGQATLTWVENTYYSEDGGAFENSASFPENLLVAPVAVVDAWLLERQKAREEKRRESDAKYLENRRAQRRAEYEELKREFGAK